VSAAAALLVSLDMLVVATALSTIRGDLGASLEQLEWTVNAYVLSFAVLMMTAAAVAPDAGWLIALALAPFIGQDAGVCRR
jgi:MFS family permease